MARKKRMVEEDRSHSADSAGEAADSQEKAPLFVAGIGASAGGFEALERFFAAMPDDSGMALVVVQHLSPDHKSLMVELLSRHTAMKVVQASDGMALDRDTVFLLPPRKVMTVRGGRLHLSDRSDHPLPTFPIDIFLNSLAEDAGKNGIGIILSGTGSDGSRGIRSIKEAGGLIIAQDPVSSKFDGMPNNAIATGLADFVLMPEQMPGELVKYVMHPLTRGVRQHREKAPEQENKLARIYALLKDHSGVDFTFYKQSTVLRRIERRLSINQIDTLENYVKYLYANPGEVNVLYKDLLIGVTRFFRDPDAFDLIKRKALPELFKSRPGPLRVWVCGCSTGEEAYSLAMLFREYMDESGDRREVKIFATDIDKEALEFASNGLYPENIAADLTPERFHGCFVKSGDGYRVAKPVREMVIFALQNIIKDPPFNKIDLLCCRNLLIYLQPVLQQKVMSFFNFALSDSGFLFLGPSETVGTDTSLFSAYDTKWKVYRCRGRRMPLPAEGFSFSTVRPKAGSGLFRGASAAAETSRERTVGGILEELMDRFVPPALIISQENEVVHIRGDVTRFVSLKPGKTSLSVSNLVRKDLSIALETGVNKAFRENTPTAYKDIRLKDPQGEIRLNLDILPYLDDRTGEKLAAVVFEEIKERELSRSCEEVFDLDAKARQRITDLEGELQYTRENLQATVEEVETTNEELQATNEEMLSANEELQSTNEELQSVNEELITVNAEYQSKIAELTELNNDMNNLLSSTDIGVIFLDRDLAVRKFTPAIREEVNLMDHDIGRPISHISLNLRYDRLVEDAQQVLAHLAPLEREVEAHSGKTLLMRLLPYVTLDNAVKGVVITFVDVSSVKQARARLRKFSKAVEANPSMVVLADAKGAVEYVNASFSNVTGYTPEEMAGRPVQALSPDEQGAAEVKRIIDSVNSGMTWTGQLSSRRKDGTVFVEQASILPVADKSGKVSNFLKLSQDVTGMLDAARTMASQRARLEELEALARAEKNLAQATLDAREDLIVVLDTHLNVAFLNRAASAALGLEAGAALGRPWVESFVPQAGRNELRKAFSALLQGKGEPNRRYSMDIIGINGSLMPVRWVDKTLHEDGGVVTGIMIIGSPGN